MENLPAEPTQATLDAADQLGGPVQAFGDADQVSDAQLETVMTPGA